MASLRTELAAALREIASRGLLSSPVLFRGDAERDFLLKWIGERSSPHPGSGPAEAATAQAAPDACGKCPGARDRKPAFGTGENGLMIILNPPRLVSSEEKSALKAQAVAMLKKMLASIHVEYAKSYITSLVKCESDGATPGQMFMNCRSILSDEIERIAPGTVLVMGELTPLKKIIDAHPGVTWFAVEHPITLIKNPDMKKPAWETLKLVGSRMGGSATRQAPAP